MKFINVHSGKTKVILNVGNVTEIYQKPEGGCDIYLNCGNGDAQARMGVDENIDEIENAIRLLGF